MALRSTRCDSFAVAADAPRVVAAGGRSDFGMAGVPLASPTREPMW
ncbi:hypothetical protein OG429_13070 [Streptomyces sp. NBC_00190]|nr:hypothetical protein [Streptomyces sp. NBC_00190]WSZ40199.1 hypothetical protein OG239_16075 [Streptomyces sp. NBC_00868]